MKNLPIIKRASAIILAVVTTLTLGSACGKSSTGLPPGRCPAPNYTYCCAVQWNPAGTKYPMGTLTEAWKVYSPNATTATAACGAAIAALGGTYDVRPGIGVKCIRSPGGAGCTPADRTLGPTSEGPTIQSYTDPHLKVVQSYALGKLAADAAAASGLPRPYGLDCNTCADNAANGTCSEQVTACDADPACQDPATSGTCCASCISCLYAGGSPSACGCNLSDSTVLNLANCLLAQCPQCADASNGTGGSPTSTLLPDGSPCSSNDECQSCVCDADNSTCVTP